MSAVATAPESVTPAPAAAVPGERLYRLSVEQYHEIAKHGILTSKDKVVLIRGLLVKKMTKHRPHTLATGLTRVALERIVPTGWYVDAQEPISFQDSEPEPDISVIRGERRQYAHSQPKAKDAGMLVEVSEDSLAEDRTVQLELFAEGRIPVYWIVNLVDRQVEVYTEPSGPVANPSYARKQVFRENDSVPVVLDGVEVGRLAVRDLLP